jgi:hypothetical protein
MPSAPKVTEDPVIPFRVSHANAIASTASGVKFLTQLYTAGLAIMGIVLTYLLMR